MNLSGPLRSAGSIELDKNSVRRLIGFRSNYQSKDESCLKTSRNIFQEAAARKVRGTRVMVVCSDSSMRYLRVAHIAPAIPLSWHFRLVTEFRRHAKTNRS